MRFLILPWERVPCRLKIFTFIRLQKDFERLSISSLIARKGERWEEIAEDGQRRSRNLLSSILRNVISAVDGLRPMRKIMMSIIQTGILNGIEPLNILLALSVKPLTSLTELLKIRSP